MKSPLLPLSLQLSIPLLSSPDEGAPGCLAAETSRLMESLFMEVRNG